MRQIQIDIIRSKALIMLALIKKRVATKTVLVTGMVLLLVFVAASSSVLAYSLKLKQEGNTEYKNQKYTEALVKYQTSRSFWFPEKLNFKLRDRDLEAKTKKAEIMIKSNQNYLDGLKEFDLGNLDSAAYYFFRVADNDPHFGEAKNKIIAIEEKKKDSVSASKETPKNVPIIKPLEKITTKPLDNSSVTLPKPEPVTTAQTPKDMMPDKPFIDSFCDNKGNCVHSQFADPSSNSSLYPYPKVHVGETLNFTIKVSGQETSGVLAFIIDQGYDWLKEGGKKSWGTDLTHTKTFSEKDITTSGYPVYAYIKSQNDNYHRRSSGCNWTDYSCDDSATLMYTVLP